MKTHMPLISGGTLLSAFLLASCASPREMEELKLDDPEWMETSPLSEHLRRLGFREPNYTSRREPYLVPRGTKLLSRGKKVTSSDDWPLVGDLQMVTDGDTGERQPAEVEIQSGLQWVQIDLAHPYHTNTIVMWRFVGSILNVYKDVIILASQFEDFRQYRVVFNNDTDNSAGFGVGEDREYIEWYRGKIFSTGGLEARYFRFYSNGSDFSEANVYVEIEIYGTSA